MVLFILLMQDSKLAKSPSSIRMPQVHITSLQNQLFMSLNPIMLKAFEIDIETADISIAAECPCVRVSVCLSLVFLRAGVELGDLGLRTEGAGFGGWFLEYLF